MKFLSQVCDTFPILSQKLRITRTYINLRGNYSCHLHLNDLLSSIWCIFNLFCVLNRFCSAGISSLAILNAERFSFIEISSFLPPQTSHSSLHRITKCQVHGKLWLGIKNGFSVEEMVQSQEKTDIEAIMSLSSCSQKLIFLGQNPRFPLNLAVALLLSIMAMCVPDSPPQVVFLLHGQDQEIVGQMKNAKLPWSPMDLD